MENSTSTEQSLTEYYEEDYDRMDSLFKSFQEFKKTDFPLAVKYFTEFKYGIHRHIIWEEEIFFPLFEEKTGMIGRGPTVVMRAEHRLITQYLDAIDDKLTKHDIASDEEERILANILTLHNSKEETIFYPAIDRILFNDERKRVFVSMKNMPGERYTMPLPQYNYGDKTLMRH